MAVALTMHLRNGDAYITFAPALTLLIVFILLFVGGSGPLSYDAL
jgi:hypothetical protein